MFWTHFVFAVILFFENHYREISAIVRTLKPTDLKSQSTVLHSMFTFLNEVRKSTGLLAEQNATKRKFA